MATIRNFLIVYNWRESKLDHWRDIDRAVSDRKLTPEQARDLYLEYERRFKPADGYEVVLVGADSIETLRRTHGHYFDSVETNPFTELLGDGSE
jgi:hypothetical protein